MSVENRVKYACGPQALYNAISAKDPDTIYFITDSRRIYKGDMDFTQNVFPVVNFPESGANNKIYIHKNTLELRIFADGNWIVATPGYIQTIEDLKNPENEGKLATISAIKKYIDEILDARVEELVQSASFDDETGTIKLYGTDKENPLTEAELFGVAHNPSYDVENLKITIPQYGKQDLVIPLPKDRFLSDAYLDENYTFDSGTSGPAIVLVTSKEDEPDENLAIDASSMVNDYKSGKTDTIQVEITDEHKIKARIIIDANTSDGTLMIWDNVAKKIGTVGVKINNAPDGELDESNESIPTAKIIAAAIKKASAEIMGLILDEGNPDEIVISTEKGIIRSGKVIGGAVLSENPDANTIATEAAVHDAISWKILM